MKRIKWILCFNMKWSKNQILWQPFYIIKNCKHIQLALFMCTKHVANFRQELKFCEQQTTYTDQHIIWPSIWKTFRCIIYSKQGNSFRYRIQLLIKNTNISKSFSFLIICRKYLENKKGFVLVLSMFRLHVNTHL